MSPRKRLKDNKSHTYTLKLNHFLAIKQFISIYLIALKSM
jgi:hypothetical protein